MRGIAFLAVGLLAGAAADRASRPASPLPPPPSAGAVTAQELLRALGSCRPMEGTSRFRPDAEMPASIPVCRTGAVVWWTSDMDIDCDGGSEPACKADRSYQPRTAATDARGRPLDASHLPYVVVPSPSNGFHHGRAGLHMGSVVAVVHGGRVVYAVVGDTGPAGTIGEGSYALAEQLGIDPDPNDGGTSEEVTFVAFTGREAVVVPIDDAARAQAVGERLAAALVAARLP